MESSSLRTSPTLKFKPGPLLLLRPAMRRRSTSIPKPFKVSFKPFNLSPVLEATLMKSTLSLPKVIELYSNSWIYNPPYNSTHSGQVSDNLSRIFDSFMIAARYYYNSNTQELAIHIGSHLHNDFVNCLAKTINTSLDEHRVLRRPKSKSPQAIADGPELVNYPGEKEGVLPDWPWGIKEDSYPGVVLEVGYSQSGTDLEEKAKR